MELPLDDFSQLVGMSSEHSKVFLDLAQGNSSKAIELYEKLTNRSLSRFEVITQTQRVSSARRTEPATLFSEPCLEERTTSYQGTIVSFYTNGFTINHGPLRDFHSPQNRQFVEELQQGMVQGACPRELLTEEANDKNEIKIRIERKNHPWNPFLLPRSVQAPMFTVPETIHLYGIWIQKDLPMTKIKIGLAEWKQSLILTCNRTNTLEHIFQALALPLKQDASRLTLVMIRPPQKWTWESRWMTVEEAHLDMAHLILQSSNL